MNATEKGKYKIILRANGRGSIELDGVELPHVERVVVLGRARQPPIVRVTLTAAEVEVDADARCSHRHVSARYDGNSSWWACADCDLPIDTTIAMRMKR